MLRLLQTKEAAPRKAVTRTPKPKTTDKVKGRDLDLATGLVLPAPTHLVKRQWIADAQAGHAKDRPAGLHQDAGQPPLWINNDGQVWAPPDETLRRCLYGVAHQGAAGHRQGRSAGQHASSPPQSLSPFPALG